MRRPLPGSEGRGGRGGCGGRAEEGAQVGEGDLERSRAEMVAHAVARHGVEQLERGEHIAAPVGGGVWAERCLEPVRCE